MALKLRKDLEDLIEDKSVLKILATADDAGAPYAVESPFLRRGDDGSLIHLELLEKSETGRNLLRSLWYDRKVAVTLGTRDGKSFVIRGKAVRAAITGPAFRSHYEEVRRTLGDADLSAVWFIEPEEVVEETYGVRKQEEERVFPFSIHLDRLT